MNFYDSHCHLNSEQMFPERKKYIDNFYENWGRGLVNVGASGFYNEKGLEIAKSATSSQVFVKAILGWHPEVVGTEITQENLLQKIAELKKMIEDNRAYVVGVGECWIDLHFPWSFETLPLQKELFMLQCDLARELNLPLIIHSRDAFDQTFDVLKKYSDLVVYVHCRWYGPEEMKKLQSLNFKKLYVGFCGNVTYKKADTLRESLKLVSLTHLLLETDAPYLTPQIIRGEQNQPANVKYIYEFVSEYLNIELSDLCIQVEKNFKEIYGI